MASIRILFLLGALCVTSTWAAPGDTAVQQAQRAFETRKLVELEHAARNVPAGHVLFPYVEYWRLTLSSGPGDSRIADFLARYPGSRMAESLRGDWLKSLGARQAWAMYLAEYPRLNRPDYAHQCYAHRAEWAQGNRAAQREAVSLWFSGRDMPSACTPLFEQLIEAGLIREDDIWSRLRLALEAGNPGVARIVANALPDAQRPDSALFDLASRDPSRVLNARDTLDPGRRGDRELALYVLDLLAKRDSSEAERALRKWEPHFSEEEQRIAWARLATWAARRHEAIALSWFQRAGKAATNDFQREWWVRAALRARDWQTVRHTIESMDKSVQTQAVWRYWLARALQAAGRRSAANAIFLPLSGEHHYYGQLAQEELGPVAQAPSINVKAGGNEVDAVARLPGS